MVAGVELRRDGIFSSRLAATALYTTSPSVAYLRIDLRIHHNEKSTTPGLEPAPGHHPGLLSGWLNSSQQHIMPLSAHAMLLPVMGSVSWSNGQSINLAPGEDLF